ncbi:DNA-dependent metalloprotease dvc-1 [Achroia grisella]|uniref:DNA-dependent metalloprotease dvc-1 n=1 Tax=Achroia grisella TaxID=688607 RepID=UPI0027D27BEF|nr:DNA-dependent metalloprotease dvc-1 [Achroia grisella]
MNLGDPELELIDPTPNVHTLFLHFDKLFFFTKLASRAVVRWSKRMYSCAGICSYEGRGGLCDIALSEPLLKLRSRKDLIETLLHEMIHAYLFITCQDRERDGHGPNFKSHMHRINKSAGLNISIYHDFHDEVKLYLTHWWRCNGPCQTRKPYFGIVRRSRNSAPGPNDYWWSTHQKTCGGTFVKIKEPEKKAKAKTTVPKTNADIKKYINNNNNIVGKNIKTINDIPKDVRKPLTPIIKNSKTVPTTGLKSNNINTVIETKKGVTINPQNSPKKNPTPFTGNGQTIAGSRKRSNSADVVETVRDIWAKKFLPENKNSQSNSTMKGKQLIRNNSICGTNNLVKSTDNKNNSHFISPPMKVRKIDDYFKNTATTVLKDLYGQDFKITQTDKKIIAVPVNLVDCPVCKSKVDSNVINRHLDECLNKEVLDQLSQDHQNFDTVQSSQIIDNTHIVKSIKTEDISKYNNISRNFTNIQHENVQIKKEPAVDSSLSFDPIDINKVKSIVKKITFDKHIRKSDNFIVPKEEPKEPDIGFLSSFLDDVATETRIPPIKIEPGTSKDILTELNKQKCPCCGMEVDKPIGEHLDDCISFFNDTDAPVEGTSNSFANNTIIIDDDDDDDIFDETMTMNATGTKTPCPCCLEMIETTDMNAHLDECLS